jgi:DNA-binding NarL/FixJ family response regulator
MQGLPPKPASVVSTLRVVVWGPDSLTEALQFNAVGLQVMPVTSSLDVAVRVAQADVILVDWASNPANARQKLAEKHSKAPVLVLVAPDQVREAVTAGALGAIHPDSGVTEIVAALHAVDEGLSVFDGEHAEAMRPAPVVLVDKAPAAPTLSAAGTPAEHLTGREKEVLPLLAEGLSNKEIAGTLHISEHTAKFHVNSILNKMGAQKRVEAVVRAARMGLIHI